MLASDFLKRASLYLICDGETCARHGITLADFVAGAVAGGATTIQYRHKEISPLTYERNLSEILPLAQRATLIVNDHAEVAERLQLPLHLGQDDALPPQLAVPYGRSTHSLAELERALTATPPPAYIALGTMFASPTKPDVATNRHLIEEYLARTSLPLVLIGGITRENVRTLPRSERISYAIIGDAFRYGATSAAVQRYVAEWILENRLL